MRRGWPPAVVLFEETFVHCTTKVRDPEAPWVWNSTLPAGFVPTAATFRSSYHGASIVFGWLALNRLEFVASDGFEAVAGSREK